jgi:hypothetical protein
LEEFVIASSVLRVAINVSLSNEISSASAAVFFLPLDANHTQKLLKDNGNKFLLAALAAL